MALGERLHPRPCRARGCLADRAAQDARRRRRPLPRRHDREGARDRGDRGRAQARQRPRRRVCGDARGRAGLALLHRPALPRQRPALRRAAAGAVLVQLGLRRMRDLSRLRPGDRRRLRPRHPGPSQDAAQRRDQDDPDAGLDRDPGRPAQVRRRGRHPPRHRLAAAHRRAARLGDRGLAELEGQVEPAVVRHPPLLRLPRVEGVQDAHPGAALQIPQLHPVPILRRRAAQARGAALADRLEGRRRRGSAAFEARHAGRRGLGPGAARGAARPHRARPDAAADRPAARLLRPARRRRGARRRPRRAGAPLRRDPHPAALPLRRRHRLPHARPPEPHPLRRRGAADQPDDGAGDLARQHPVRARRAVDRPASARHEPDRAGDAPPARRRQHPRRRRARPGGDARRRPPDRHGARSRRARRHDRLRRHARGGEERRHADRRLPRRAQAGRHGHQAPGERLDAAPRPRRRARPQPEGHHGRVPAPAPGVRDRRLGLGQEHPGAGHPRAGAGAPLRQGDRHAGRARRAARRRLARRHGLRRPEPDRQDRALQSGELRRRVRRDQEALRPGAARAAARLRRRHVQLQRRQRPLRDLRRLGLRARGDAVPLRRLPALPRLRRPPVPRRDPRRDDRAPLAWRRRTQPQRRRRPRAHRRRGGAAVPRRPRGGSAAAAHPRSGPRIREAGPAGADPLRRRGAAPQARRLPRRGGAELEREPPGAGATRHALHVRRADDRPALRRHRQADALVQEAPRGGPLDRRHRAQPRRDPRLRLADRPRARGRRGGRRARRLRHAGGREAPRQLAHREGAARVRRRARLRGPRGRGGAAAAAAAQARARARRRRREHPHRQRARAQPEGARRLDPARQVLGRDRRFGLGQEHARLRHPVQRGPAALSRVAQRLRPLDRAAGGPARGRRGLRHPADGGDRAATVARRQEEHGRDDDRGLALPAPALRQAGPAALRQRRHRGAAAERRADRGADPRAPCRRAHRRARAARRRAQGRLHRPRQVGEEPRPQPPARRRRLRQGRSVAAARPLQGAHPRAAGRRRGRRPRRRGEAARPARQGARRRQGRAAPARAPDRPARRDARRHADEEGRRGQGVLDPARLPGVRHQLSRARPAHVQLQLQARLVHHLRRHGAEADPRAAQGLRRLGARQRRPRPRAELPGRGGRGRGRRRRGVPRLRRHPAQPGVARGHLRRPVDRLDRAVVGQRRAASGSSRWRSRAATPRSRATSSPRSRAASSSSRRWASAT